MSEGIRRDNSREDEQQLPNILLERCYFIFFYQQCWSRPVISRMPRLMREAIRQFYWHSLVGYDDRINRALGIRVRYIEWSLEKPNWEEVCRQQLTDRHRPRSSVLTRRTTRW